MRQRQPAGNRLFPLVAGVLLATATAWADPRVGVLPTDRIKVALHEDALALSWSDTEERLQGGIRPTYLRAGQPFTVSLEVGSFEGAAFEGPLVLTLREAGAHHGQGVTVTRGARHWEATFVPESAGPHVLDVNFRTTRAKFLHAALEVGPSPVPRLIGWSVLGLVGLLLVGYTVRTLTRKPPQDPPPEASGPPEAPPPPSTGPVPEATPAAAPVPEANPAPSPEAPSPEAPSPASADPGKTSPAAESSDPTPGTDSGGPTGR